MLKGADRPRHVQMVGERNVDCIDIGIFQEILIAPVMPRDPQSFRRPLGSLGIAGCDREHLAELRSRNGGDDFFGGNACRAQHAPSQFAHDRFSFKRPQ